MPLDKFLFESRRQTGVLMDMFPPGLVRKCLFAYDDGVAAHVRCRV